jgi:Transposase, Mutator family
MGETEAPARGESRRPTATPRALPPPRQRPTLQTANVLNKVAVSVQVNMKADLREIYGASTRAAAEIAIEVFAEKYGAKYEKAVACLTKDKDALLAFFDFLKIGHDSGLGRLPHVYDRLAVENGRGNQLRACHLQAPRH